MLYQRHNPVILIFVIFLCLVVAAWLRGSDHSSVSEQASINREKSTADEQNLTQVKVDEDTVSSGVIDGTGMDGVNSDRFQSQLQAYERSNDPFTIDQEIFFQQIEKIRVDQHGDIIVDALTKSHLDEVIGYLGPDLTPEELDRVFDMVKTYMPYTAGEQTTELLANYYDFYKAQISLLGGRSPETLTESISIYEEVKSLRTTHLGEQISSALFDDENAFMTKVIDEHAARESAGQLLGQGDPISAE